jgi:hypothetical protein
MYTIGKAKVETTLGCNGGKAIRGKSKAGPQIIIVRSEM